MPANKSYDVNFEFSAPNDMRQKLEDYGEALRKIPKEYKDVFDPSIKKRLGKLFSSTQNKKLEWQKQELESKLKILKNEVVRIFLTYYEDKDIRSKGATRIKTIDDYCKKAGIKKIETKGYSSIAFAVNNSLKKIKISFEKINDDVNTLKVAYPKIVQEDNFRGKISEIKDGSVECNAKRVAAEKLGINVNTEEYRNLFPNLQGVLSKKAETKKVKERANIEEQLREFEKCDFQFDALVAKLRLRNTDSEWKKILQDLRELLKDLEGLSKRLPITVRKVNAIVFYSEGDIDELSGQLQEYTQELDRKIEFADKELKSYKVFDNNKGLDVSFSYKGKQAQKTEIEKIWNGSWVAGRKADPQYFKGGSQDCLPIAQGKEKLNIQYDHENGDGTLSIYKGPYYIIVSKEAKQVAGTLTLRSEKEMGEYIQQALQAGTFEGIKV